MLDAAPADRREAHLAPHRPIRLALSKADAATALCVSIDFFDEYIAHELRIVRRGRRR
jgi:hypothetical protein